MSGSAQLLPVRLSLHIWSGQWGIPSFDPLCLAAVLYLQLAIPGRFSVVECSHPDISPTGQLPFLVHDRHVIASFPSIVKYVSGLQNADFDTYPKANIDAGLNAREKAQKVAYSSHTESRLGDLVYHCLYSSQENWQKLIGIIMASMLPVPQKYYVPRRIRDSYHDRLLAAGLWTQFTEELPTQLSFTRDIKPAESKKDGISKNSALSRAFEKEKILQKAQAVLDIYQHLLNGKSYVFRNQISSLDILIASHILLLVNPPYPDILLKNLVVETYPALFLHARRVFDAAFGDGTPPFQKESPSISVWDVFPSWRRKTTAAKAEATAEEIKDRQLRWGFIGLVLGSFAAYVAILSPSTLATWQSAEEHSTYFPTEDA